MRLKKVKGADENVNASKNVIKNYLEYKGNFQSLFENNNPIYLEIGMGKGKFIIENAKRYPNINFIGIEKYASVLVRATTSVQNIDLPNLKFILMDAKEIDEVFAKEIDKIYLNFSDPWPKERHKKRRLTSDIFLNKYELIFKNRPLIEFKTDNRKLFEYSVQSFTNNNYKIDEISLNLYDDNKEDNISTEYETKFHDLGNPIYYIKVSK